ncbi:hypothetical protein [Nitrobacter vulgaris]|uniref:Uncharacterized protein n=1 Tax=Nitrobacter vulgaris TaxID=29421 RepID=A0A1V4HZE9_NITVU|nr:hypothetical protein [Nitrobacter vulgaris]OPH83245.1 hypothetical protein B2M20_08150 [Nitrobacter vulgaris]
MIIKLYVVGPLMRSLQAGLGGFLGGSSSQPLGLDGLAAVHHGGYGPGDAISATRYIHPAYFNNASRFHSGIGPGERPAIIKYDESVLTPGEMQLAPAGASPNITFNVIEDSSRAGQREQRRNGNGDIDITQFVDAITAKNAANPGSSTSRVLSQRGQLARR